MPLPPELAGVVSPWLLRSLWRQHPPIYHGIYGEDLVSVAMRGLLGPTSPTREKLFTSPPVGLGAGSRPSAGGIYATGDPDLAQYFARDMGRESLRWSYRTEGLRRAKLQGITDRRVIAEMQRGKYGKIGREFAKILRRRFLPREPAASAMAGSRLADAPMKAAAEVLQKEGWAPAKLRDFRIRIKPRALNLYQQIMSEATKIQHKMGMGSGAKAAGSAHPVILKVPGLGWKDVTAVDRGIARKVLRTEFEEHARSLVAELKAHKAGSITAATPPVAKAGFKATMTAKAKGLKGLQGHLLKMARIPPEAIEAFSTPTWAQVPAGGHAAPAVGAPIRKLAAGLGKKKLMTLLARNWKAALPLLLIALTVGGVSHMMAKDRR